MQIDEQITPFEIYESGDYLYIIINGYFKTKVGDTIKFTRNVYSETNDTNIGVALSKRSVLEVNEIKKGNIVKQTILRLNTIEKTRLDIRTYNSVDSNKRIIFNTVPNIFAQDIVFAKQHGISTTLQHYDYNTGTYVDTVTDLRMVETDTIDGKNNYEYIVSGCQTPENFLFNMWNVVDYHDCNIGDSENPNYETMPYYFPSKGDANIIWGDFDVDLTKELMFYKHNAFFYKDENETKSTYGDITGYKCHLWEDVVSVDGKQRNVKENGVDKYNVIKIVKESEFWQIPVGLAQSADYAHLNQETNVIEHFADKIIDEVIESAPVIDMEKVKYAPYYLNNNKYSPLTSVTYNLHFRCRDVNSDGWQYIENSSSLWNSGVTPSNLADNNWSDMLYYLGFTDGDVQNQKMKLKKSFLRLSFYDSKDILTQKLLYYSTIFMDGGELFGKYLKAKNELLKAKKVTNNVVLNSCETDYRLDCNFTVRDEYFTEKSSEGFNFYYFPDAIENGERTIYMKVEFNHAKYGRTIPMIVWPQGVNSLTLEQAKDGLYIPIKIKLLDENQTSDGEKHFVYEFEQNNFVKINDNTITLNLAEPKLG